MSENETKEFSVSQEPELQNQSWVPASTAGSADGPKRILVLVLVAAVLLGLLGAWWWWRSFKSEVAKETLTTTHAERPMPPVDLPSVDQQEAQELVTLSNSDELLRRAAAVLSSNPRLAAWLVNDGLIERFVKVTTNVAYGEDPKSHVPFMRPGRNFEVVKRGDATTISSRSFARYTPLIEVLESLDANGSAQLYHRFEPAMEEAFQELGYPGTFRQTLDQAITTVLKIEVPEGPLRVEEGVLSYRFADPQLESASDLEKLLYRMGPENQRRLRSEIRRLSSAL